MCGIFGHYAPDGADAALVERMAHILSHRGPDGWGAHCEGAFAFGAGRLAIIDLSAPAGPIFNEDRRVAVAFNGEIYNYKPLRVELERAGHHFATHTDTEVIVHGYEQWGVGVIERLRGMFGICIWDAARERYVLARDRIGEKPLYYAQVADGFIFASEAKALFAHPALRRAVNTEALPHFLVTGYVPPPQTLFAGIHKLAPGERLVLERGVLHTDTYWQPRYAPTSTLSYDEAVRQVRAKLTECVEMQMMSDVPIGAFLSGGVDSTAVAALMQRASRQPINTFTVGFDMLPGSDADRKFNVDARYAAQAAQHIGARHREIRLRADESLAELLPHLVYAQDEPAQVATFVQTAYVAALARVNGVPVLLNGEAGDELFLGYQHYRADQTLARYLALPRVLRESMLTPLLERLSMDSARKLAQKSRHSDPAARYLEWSRILAHDRLPDLLMDGGLVARSVDIVHPDLRAQLAVPQTPHFADRIAYANLRRVVAENYNMRVDKMSMAMSIETRAPFEDYEMVDLAFSLPLSYKLRGGDSKRLLKDAIRDLVPASILSRPKWGFNPPQSEWLRTCLRPLVEQVLAPERVRAADCFQPDAVQRVVHAHIVERKYEVWAVWSLLVFHLWHALYIDESLTLDHRLTAGDIAATLTSPPVST
ncbi:MAG: asparagine synthase (glutamine-hydrolyzing) [Chloroflexota bacterium]|nr:asparagine synthase (glutamine-hydrolyzing) [Chloroflexota bacterium]